LIGMLRSANQSTNRPKMFVGITRFPLGSLPSLDDRRWVQPAEPSSGIGDEFSLRLNLRDIPSRVAGSSGSEGPAELTLHFGWHRNHLHVAVRDNGSPPCALRRGHTIITLDVATCSSAGTMHHRGVCVMVNGPWTACKTGLCVMRAGSTVAMLLPWTCHVLSALAMHKRATSSRWPLFLHCVWTRLGTKMRLHFGCIHVRAESEPGKAVGEVLQPCTPDANVPCCC